jgi:hypothetical protein
MSSRVDIEVELTDPLALNEVTLQFAGYRYPVKGMPQPTALHFTYQ